ncbi:MAG: 50S ribosomal protein L17 [Candidatus Moraniibacteriota bacterium]|nr:MAG: 50S ribosomal protein L17 [Candidatus Moranbacteria bacterium]
MKHRSKGRILSRTRDQRHALLKTLLGSLIMRERITTTLAKAKEIKNHIDQLINKGKVAKNNVDRRAALVRLLRSRLSLEATKKVTSDFADRFVSRQSGYSRVIKLDRRKGDGAEMAVIELILDPLKDEKKKEKKAATK